MSDRTPMSHQKGIEGVTVQSTVDPTAFHPQKTASVRNGFMGKSTFNNTSQNTGGYGSPIGTLNNTL